MKEKVALAKKFGIESIEALEISTSHHGATLHILGYSRDFNDQFLIEKLQKENDGYSERTQRFIKHVNSTGIVSVDMTDLEKKFKGFRHDFQVIVAAAEKLNLPIVEIKHKLKDGFEREKGQWMLSPQEAIDIIHQAGGIAIWAHPKVVVGTKELDFKKTLSDLISYQIDGLEVYHSNQSMSDEKELAKIAIKHGLLMT